jgi:hypothetical protein
MTPGSSPAFQVQYARKTCCCHGRVARPTPASAPRPRRTAKRLHHAHRRAPRHGVDRVYAQRARFPDTPIIELHEIMRRIDLGDDAA